MKRRNLLKSLVLMPSALLTGSCKRQEFARDTVIFGEVIDQDEKPVEGFRFRLSGDEGGWSRRSKFHIEAYTDSLGKFRLSQRVPKGTDLVMLFLDGSETISVHDPMSLNYYEVYYEIDGKYELIIGVDVELSRSKWGKSIEFKFKIEKI